MTTTSDRESGLPFKIITAGQEITAPSGAFRVVKPVGASATWKGLVTQNAKSDGGDDYATGGNYANAGLDSIGTKEGEFQKIAVSVGTVVAEFK